MLSKLCNGCGKIIPFGHVYCDKCSAAQISRHSIYDAKYRDKRAAKFYHSPPWLAARAAALIRAGGLCERCASSGKVVAATAVHHKIPIHTNWSRRLDLHNLACLCAACHSAAHAELLAGGMKKA